MSGFADLMKSSLQEAIDNWKNVPKSGESKNEENMERPAPAEPLPSNALMSKPRRSLQDKIKETASGIVGNRLSTIEKDLHEGVRDKLRTRKSNA
jgi:hypothetical protein